MVFDFISSIPFWLKSIVVGVGCVVIAGVVFKQCTTSSGGTGGVMQVRASWNTDQKVERRNRIWMNKRKEKMKRRMWILKDDLDEVRKHRILHQRKKDMIRDKESIDPMMGMVCRYFCLGCLTLLPWVSPLVGCQVVGSVFG